MSHVIELGTQERLKLLFSYPNTSSTTEALADTIQHWFQQTLERDKLAARGARATVRVKGPDYFLELEGPPELAASFRTYQERLPRFLDNGWEAFTRVIPRLIAEKRWDPSPTLDSPKPYRPWRFFLTLGTALVHQRSLQFFHYPPIRLLEETRDYLKDPVPERCEELLRENGVAKEDVHLYEAIVDAVPIAAEDDQGSKPWDKAHFGLIPIEDFSEYQQAQVRLLLNPAPNDARYTIPIVVYGSHPRQIFEKLYGVALPLNSAATVEIIPGMKTPVMATNHPYRFYATVQGGDSVGSGRILSDNSAQTEATRLMINDLAAVRWQKVMADNPSLDPQAVLSECHAYWKDDAQRGRVEALVLRQGSLSYPEGDSLAYSYSVSLPDAVALVQSNRSIG